MPPCALLAMGGHREFITKSGTKTIRIKLIWPKCHPGTAGASCIIHIIILVSFPVYLPVFDNKFFCFSIEFEFAHVFVQLMHN